MTHEDYGLLALCLWREARGEGAAGQIAVGCVVRNRVEKNGTSYFVEITKPWAFSSITAEGDPQLGLYPSVLDHAWLQCQDLAGQIVDGVLNDSTGGATLYWNPNGIKSSKTFTTLVGQVVAFPQSWNPAVVTETTQIGAHIFLKEN
jgi:spore germination cell wall hydrolase CwlJ-like protein